MTEKEYNNDILGMVHDTLVCAVKQYKAYLLVYGTAPDMTLLEQLEKDVDKVLSHDGEDVTPFRQTATGLIYPVQEDN